jgi:hypothetical protein
VSESKGAATALDTLDSLSIDVLTDDVSDNLSARLCSQYPNRAMSFGTSTPLPILPLISILRAMDSPLSPS